MSRDSPGKDNRPSPLWLTVALYQVELHKEDYERDIKIVAIRVAKRDRSKTVGVKRIDEAFEAVHGFGISSIPWWRTSEAEVGVRAGQLGLVWSVPDVTAFFHSFPLTIMLASQRWWLWVR